MAGQVYALLVGINDYGGRVAALSGCLNDIDEFEKILRVLVPERRLHMATLKEAQATRRAIVAGFGAHLAQAGVGDTAIFYFSGHGSVEPVDERFWRLEPSGFNQTIVCADSRRPGIPDLADKELNHLIGTVAKGNAHVLVILDCCHSGGGTRDPAKVGPQVRVRSAPPATEPRSGAIGADAYHQSVSAPHVSLSACEATQLAVELPIAGKDQGVFSAMLRRAVTVLGPGATYRSLLGALSASVRDRVFAQEPVGYAYPPEALDQPLFGGAVTPRQPGLTLEWYSGRWWIDAGSVHGIQPPQDEQTTVLAVLPAARNAQPNPAGTAPLGHARVTHVQPGRSAVTVDSGWQPDEGHRYPALVIDVPLPPASVQLSGDPAAVTLVRETIAGSAHVVEKAETSDEAGRFLVRAEGGQLTVARPDGSPIAPAVPATAAGAAIVRHRLEHLSRWHLVKRLENPTSKLAGAVRLHVATAVPGGLAPKLDHIEPLTPNADGIIEIAYRWAAAGWQPPHVFLYVENDTDLPLYCALLDLTDSFGIHTRMLATTQIPARAVAVASEGRAVPVKIPKNRLEANATAVDDWLKVVAGQQRFSSDAFDLPRLDQDYLGPSRSLHGSRNVLDRIAHRAMTRSAADETGAVSDWTTTLVNLRTFIPIG